MCERLPNERPGLRRLPAALADATFAPSRPRATAARRRAPGALALAAALVASTASCDRGSDASHHPPVRDAPAAPPGAREAAGGPHSAHQAHQARGAADAGHAAHGPHAAAPAGPPDAEAALRRVAETHGEAGPWAVAGYRMGRHAIAKLGLGAHSHDLDVTHRSPASPQYACIADGAAVATGASVGKLNLRHVEADLDHLATTYRRRSTGQEITLRPSPAFAARFADRPRHALAEAGREAMGLIDDEIFVEITKLGSGWAPFGRAAAPSGPRSAARERRLAFGSPGVSAACSSVGRT